MNEAQESLYDEMHYCNVILKARQLGFSTFIAMLFLDVCVFNPNTRCGIVDAAIDDAKKKLAKVKLAYDMLPEWIKDRFPITSSSVFKIEWDNGSSIEVGTSHRGGTLQYLHISELGKIAAKFPKKAREIRTGALNTIQSGQMIFIESTAEGQEGDFYEACQTAQTKQRLSAQLTPLDFKFHFFPWWQASEYVLPENSVSIPDEMERYFGRLRADRNIILSRAQMAWYVKKMETQRDEMKREFPSTADEAFEASIEGAIFGPQIEAAEREGRIGEYPAHPNVPVHMFFDIGRRDYTSIWFAQVFAGKVRCVGYFQDMLAGLPHYTEYCFGTEHAKRVHPGFMSRDTIKGIFERKGWKIGEAVFPHDIKVEEWGSQRTRIEQAVAAGFKAKLAMEMSLHDGINAARATIPLCEFDSEGCGIGSGVSKAKGAGSNNGVGVLKQYRWEWDDTNSRWRTGVERHDANSHGAAGFRYLATSWRELPAMLEPKPKPPSAEVLTAGPGGRLVSNMSVRDIIAMKQRLKRLQV